MFFFIASVTMRSLNLTTKPPPAITPRSRTISTPRWTARRPRATRSESRRRFSDEEWTLLVFSFLSATVGSLPIVGLLSAYWFRWPDWLATWLR